MEGINFGIKVSQVKDFLYANGIETKQKKLKNKSKNVSTILCSECSFKFTEYELPISHGDPFRDKNP